MYFWISALDHRAIVLHIVGWFDESPDDSWGIYACILWIQIFIAYRFTRGSTRGPRGPKNPLRGLPALTGHHNRGSTHCSWKYSPNEDFSKNFLKKSNIGNWMISFYMFLPTCRLLFSMPRWLKKDPRVENANQGALGFPVVLAMLADQTAFNLGHDFAPGLKEMSNFSPSTLPSHQLDPC